MDPSALLGATAAADVEQPATSSPASTDAGARRLPNIIEPGRAERARRARRHRAENLRSAKALLRENETNPPTSYRRRTRTGLVARLSYSTLVANSIRQR